jgi:cytoskeletal protein RodZ
MSGNTARQLSPFIRIMIAIFLILLAVWIVLKIYIARTEPSEPPADGTKVSVFVTAGLKGYREPCG